MKKSPGEVPLSSANGEFYVSSGGRPTVSWGNFEHVVKLPEAFSICAALPYWGPRSLSRMAVPLFFGRICRVFLENAATFLISFFFFFSLYFACRTRNGAQKPLVLLRLRDADRQRTCPRLVQVRIAPG